MRDQIAVQVREIHARLTRKFFEKTESERERFTEPELRAFCMLHNPGGGEHAFGIAVEQFIDDQALKFRPPSS